MNERPSDRAQTRRASPSSNFISREARHSERNMRERSGSGECSICSFKPNPPHKRGPVYHNHYSSLFLRKLTGVEFSSASALCPSCKKEHVPYPEKRLNIVVSDSTLHQYFAPSGYIETLQYDGDTQHIDYLTIPGARISALINAFKIEYADNPLPVNLDVVLVAGYSDIVEGYARDYILDKMYAFADLITSIPTISDGRHTVTIASLMYPPQLAWFPNNGPLPYEGYKNNKDKIDWINQEIKKLNMKLEVKFPPCFHTYGVRTSNKKRFDRYGQLYTRAVKSHRWEHWHEPEPRNMLHLCTERRFKMGAALNNYFRFNDPDTPS